jgi:uncharacterized protein (TIGR03083 family)
MVERPVSRGPGRGHELRDRGAERSTAPPRVHERKNRRSRGVRPFMSTLADRTIVALRATHDRLVELVSGLGDEQLAARSGSSEWTVAQVLSHLGSGAEIGLATLERAAAAGGVVEPGFNDSVWDRWNAMSPREHATNFLDHDARLVAAFEALTAEQRGTLEIDLGFLPEPLPLTSYTGMRLAESAQHSWDVRVAFDPSAVIPADSAAVMAEHLAGGLSFLVGFIGKADALTAPAVVDIEGSGYGFVITDKAAVAENPANPTATFSGPLETAIRLVGGRLRDADTQGRVKVTGAVSLDDLRRVFPGY